jgi:hypothetical protein
MENFWVIVTLIVTIVAVTITVYYSYTAKRDLEKKLENTKSEMEMTSRPLMVMRAVGYDGASSYETDTPEKPKIEQSGAYRPLASHFSHFELYNAGNSPVIGLEISLMNNDKVILQSRSVGFLRNNEEALAFIPVKLEPGQTNYLVTEYESIRSRARKNPVWYQTWLPFTTLKCTDRGMINIIVGELDFKEVSMTNRIDAFSTKQKPR